MVAGWAFGRSAEAGDVVERGGHQDRGGVEHEPTLRQGLGVVGGGGVDPGTPLGAVCEEPLEVVEVRARAALRPSGPRQLISEEAIDGTALAT